MTSTPIRASASGAGRLSYAIVTPARDEAANLACVAACLVAQTLRPTAWVVVDNGSRDGTLEIARQLARKHTWIRVVSVPGVPTATRGGPVVRALNAGLAGLGDAGEIVVKLDADVSFGPDYFERLLAEFANDVRLGIASGNCFELEGDRWRRRPVTGTSVEGQCRAYRRSCFAEISPLEERLGWDGIDEMKANSLGWRTQTFRSLPFHHHREVAARDSSQIDAWIRQGEANHYMGYRPSYALLRALRNAGRQPTALALAWGYALAALRRTPRCPDPGVRRHVRRQQAWRHLAARARETLEQT